MKPQIINPAHFRIRVPATTANLGPGFDCLGMALNLYNEFHVMRIEKGPSVITGGGLCEGLSTTENIFFDAFNRLFKLARTKPIPVHVHVEAEIPMARGLGSSATAIAAGVLAANLMLDHRFTMDQLLLEASREEGHPDNVAPALLGGLVAATFTGDHVVVHHADPHSKWRLAVLIPSYELATEKARRAIPKTIPHKDAVFNLTRVPLVMECLIRGRHEDLRVVLDDRLHEPYRKKLIRGWDAIRAAALDSGAASTFLSGAGPTIAAFCWGDATARKVATAMGEAARRSKITASARVLSPCASGSIIHD